MTILHNTSNSIQIFIMHYCIENWGGGTRVCLCLLYFIIVKNRHLVSKNLFNSVLKYILIISLRMKKSNSFYKQIMTFELSIKYNYYTCICDTFLRLAFEFQNSLKNCIFTPFYQLIKSLHLVVYISDIPYCTALHFSGITLSPILRFRRIFLKFCFSQRL